jgi:hypothetical protein
MKPVRETRQAAQRIKVGMIGLAAIVLLIALASAIMRTATRDTAPVTATGGAMHDVVANMVDGNSAADSGGEPLAELGVAPSTGNSAAMPERVQ